MTFSEILLFFLHTFIVRFKKLYYRRITIFLLSYKGTPLPTFHFTIRS